MTTAAHATAQRWACAPGRRRDADTQASSPFVMASLTQDGRPLD
jgi:hypothetical protein